MGAVPSKVGTSKDEKLSGYDFPLRTQSSLSIGAPGDFSQVWRSNNGFRKMYRKNSQQSPVWYGSQGLLHHHQQQQEMQQECRRCDALCQLAIDKDIIIGSLEAMVAEMRIKLRAYDNQLREMRSRTQGKRQALALKLFEARERICYLEEICSTHKISTDGFVANRNSRLFHRECNSLRSDDNSEETDDDDDDDDDGLKRTDGNELPHLTPRHLNNIFSVDNNNNNKNNLNQRPSTAGSSNTTRGKPAQRSSSVLAYKRRVGTGGVGNCSNNNNNNSSNSQVINSQQWAIGSESDSLSLRNSSNSPRSRCYDTRRSATISTGTFAAMTGQHQPRRRIN